MTWARPDPDAPGASGPDLGSGLAGHRPDRPAPPGLRRLETATPSVDGGTGPRGTAHRALRATSRAASQVEATSTGGRGGLRLHLAHPAARQILFEHVHGDSFWMSGRSLWHEEGPVELDASGRRHAATTLRGRPRGRLRAMTAPRSKISPPQTPHGSPRSRAPARQALRMGQSPHRLLACSSCAGLSANHSSGSSTRHGSGRRTGAGSRGVGPLGGTPPVGGTPVRGWGPGRWFAACPPPPPRCRRLCRPGGPADRWSVSGAAGKRKAADPGVRVPRPRGGPVERLALRSPRGVDPEGGAVVLEGRVVAAVDGHVVADGRSGDGAQADGGAADGQ